MAKNCAVSSRDSFAHFLLGVNTDWTITMADRIRIYIKVLQASGDVDATRMEEHKALGRVVD